MLVLGRAVEELAMWEWWDSLESVARFYWWMSCLAFVSGLLAALFTGLAWLSGNQREHLTAQREQELAKPRQLSPQQQEQFIGILREVPSRIGVQSPSGDPEAFTLAKDLHKLFEKAGWIVGADLGATVFDPPLFGIMIQLHLGIESEEDQEMTIPEVPVLERAFNTVGMHPELDIVRVIRTRPGKSIILSVGHKPKPSD